MEGRVFCAKSAVDFVGRDVKEAEALFVRAGKRFKVGPDRAEQGESAVDVGLQERFRANDRAIYVALCSEVNDGGRAVLGQQAFNQFAVVDVALYEDVSRV